VMWLCCTLELHVTGMSGFCWSVPAVWNDLQPELKDMIVTEDLSMQACHRHCSRNSFIIMAGFHSEVWLIAVWLSQLQRTSSGNF